MISYTKAIEIIENQKLKGNKCFLNLKDCLDKITSENIFSPIDSPPFSQSAMDGYAIKFGKSDKYKIVGESKAGIAHDLKIMEGEAIRIFTGAFISDEADCVIMQEYVKKKGNEIQILKKPLINQNIRFKGEQVKKGELVLQKGIKVNPAIIGYLGSLGLKKISVFNNPKISIIITGDELVNNSSDLKKGQIYESNSQMLLAALSKEGITNVGVYKINDDLVAITNSIKNIILSSDLIILSGGISVGDYDYVKEALNLNNVNELFYKVNQKPGKPLWFGKKGNKFVLALPGNPGSSLTCFYIYFLPILRKFLNKNNIHLKKTDAILDSEIINNSGKTLFLKGILKNNKVSLLSGQSSAKLVGYSKSNVLIYVPEKTKKISVNNKVQCFIIPN